MIRTTLTLSLSDYDTRHLACLANQTRLGLLASVRQPVHVQTSNRPMQIVAAFLDTFSGPKEIVTESGLAFPQPRSSHQKLLDAWQSVNQELPRQGCAALATLLQQYQLQPAWLICLDDHRMRAWLPADKRLYILRQNELSRIRSVAASDSRSTDLPGADLTYHVVNLKENDQFLMLPPQLFDLYSAEEIVSSLAGLRQLPAKMSTLFSDARLRGMTGDHTWMAWQILTLQEDQPLADDRPMIQKLTERWRANQKMKAARKHEPEHPDESISESMVRRPDPNPAAAPLPARKRSAWLSIRELPRWILLGLPLLAAVVVIAIILIGGGGDTKETEPQESSSELAATPTPRPTLSPTPIATEPAEAIWYAVAVDRLNLREGTSTDTPLLYTFSRGDRLRQLEPPDGDWVRIVSDDDRQGYVYFPYVTLVEDDAGSDTDG